MKRVQKSEEIKEALLYSGTIVTKLFKLFVQRKIERERLSHSPAARLNKEDVSSIERSEQRYDKGVVSL